MILIFAFTLIFQSTFSFSKDQETPWFLCAFGPEVKVAVTEFARKNSCVGTAKIQAISWECGDRQKVTERSKAFLDKLNEAAKERCEDLCSDRKGSCKGVYRESGKCGFQLNEKYSASLGKRVGCHKGCNGASLIYCSLYHSGYVKVNPSDIKNDPPNCRCVTD